jgi:hypothetical protein
VAVGVGFGDMGDTRPPDGVPASFGGDAPSGDAAHAVAATARRPAARRPAERRREVDINQRTAEDARCYGELGWVSADRRVS